MNAQISVVNEVTNEAKPFARFKSLVLLLLAAWSGVAQAGRIVYVAPDGTGDGSSWANAADFAAARTSAPALGQLLAAPIGLKIVFK